MQRAKLLVNQIAALNSPFSQDELFTYIIKGLGLIYQPFTKALEARIALAMFDDLFGLLYYKQL